MPVLRLRFLLRFLAAPIVVATTVVALGGLLLTSSSAQARTWTNSQGRTLEADYVTATAAGVTLRLVDGRLVTLPPTQLSSVDRDFIAAQPPSTSAAAAPLDFNALNTLLGIPLLADANLWDDVPAEVAARLKLPAEGKTRLFEGYRRYPREPVRILKADALMLSLQATEGRITALTVMFTNRGDYQDFRKRAAYTTPGKAQLKAFDQALKTDFETLGAALTASLGEGRRESATVGGLDAGRRAARWEWGPLAIVVSLDPAQMVSLKIIPATAVAGVRLSDDQVRKLFRERIVHRANGDVILDQIPMVDQGPKGYCVPATFERYLRYAGIPADMYELAAGGGTDFGGGSDFHQMATSLDRYIRRQGRRLEPVAIKLNNLNALTRYLDEGRPVIWGLYSTENFNALSSAVTAARTQVADFSKWKPVLTPAELATIKPDGASGHACLIIGYNRASNEIAFTDSWGPQFKERWVPVAAAQKVTQDEYWVLAW